MRTPPCQLDELGGMYGCPQVWPRWSKLHIPQSPFTSLQFKHLSRMSSQLPGTGPTVGQATGVGVAVSPRFSTMVNENPAASTIAGRTLKRAYSRAVILASWRRSYYRCQGRWGAGDAERRGGYPRLAAIWSCDSAPKRTEHGTLAHRHYRLELDFCQAPRI